MQAPCTIDSFYMRYTNNCQGGYELLDLHKDQTITHHHVTTIPMTQTIIDPVHAMAARKNMPTGLKIGMKTGVTLYESTWIARVDYEKNKNDDDDNKHRK